MSCKLFFLVVCLFGIQIIHAQVNIKPSVGINFTNFSKNPVDGSFKAKVGFDIGGSIAFGRRFYFEPGVFYSVKSTQFTESGTNAEQTYNISGIRVPVTVGLRVLGNDTSAISLRALGGVSAFFLTSVQELPKADFNSVFWGLFAGVGIDIGIFFLEGKYEWSLTNVQSDVSQVDVGKSRTVFINAGLRIPLRHK